MDRLVVLGGAATEHLVHQAGVLVAQTRPPASLRPATAPPAAAEGLLAGVFGEYLVVRVRNAGGHTRLHQHDCDQLLIVTGGMGLIATATEEHRLPPGTVIFVPAGLPHWHGTVAGAGAETIYLTRTPYATTVLDPGAAPG